MSEDQYFNFRQQFHCAIVVDGNYTLGVSRYLNIKLDMESLFDSLCTNMYRFRTYWYAALESSTDRNNKAHRFLDRLKYIPRTKVYAGKMTKRSQGHYEAALRTDAGIALALGIVDLARSKKVDYIILFAGDPEYIPAIRLAQRLGVIVRLAYPEDLGDLSPHPDLLKAVDERIPLDTTLFHDFEYTNDFEYETNEDDFDNDETIEIQQTIDDVDDDDL